ncbi:MAG: hypothetical protein Q9163_005271 [Psora crenata]
MAPTRTVRSKHVSKGANKPTSSNRTKHSTSTPPKSRISKKPKLPQPKQHKTKSFTSLQNRKKQRTYTDQELGIPKLNMITPVGVEAPKGKKKGKVFIDDAPVAYLPCLPQESMMTILAIVNADKEGQIESKMMKSRQMEEIREARKKEAEKKQEIRRRKLEETKNAIKKKRKRKGDVAVAVEEGQNIKKSSRGTMEGKKKVTFA